MRFKGSRFQRKLALMFGALLRAKTARLFLLIFAMGTIALFGFQNCTLGSGMTTARAPAVQNSTSSAQSSVTSANSTPSSAHSNATTGIYYANDWCNTPNNLDDSCFSNAINDIYNNGQIGFANRREGVIIAPPGAYVFNNTVTIPAGVNISIQGSYQVGIWGTNIVSGATSVDFFHVGADNINIKNIAFLWGSSKNTAITLGTASQTTYDSHINWCWFAGQSAAIHVVNGSGLDLSHNTFDSGTNYGIYSNAQSGDLAASYIMADDLRGYSQISTVEIIGDGTTNFYGNSFSGIFDHSTSTAGAISLQKVLQTHVSGTFISNRYDDIDIENSQAVSVGPFNRPALGKTP